MRALTPQTILQRAGRVTAQIHSDNTIHVSVGDRVVACRRHGLLILEAFYQPRTFAEALAYLDRQTAGGHDWMELTNDIVQLYDAGILRDPTTEGSRLGDDPRTYDAEPVHVAMLNDQRRTASFLAGIRELVRPNDVVVEIGTGTGVLAIAAARAGASRVYAIEASGIGEVAQALFEANDLADRITLIRGWSTGITLPERADVLVTEVIGHDPFDEQVLTITADARARHLKPGARQVPAGLHLFALPVALPEAELRRRVFTPQTLRVWQEWYGIDFSPLAAASGGESRLALVRPTTTRQWPALTAPISLARIDFQVGPERILECRAEGTAIVDGRINAVLVYFEVLVSPNIVLSMHPTYADPSDSWLSTVLILGSPLTVTAGEGLVVHYRFDGQRSRVTVSLTT